MTMMDEMAATLARRRAKNKDPPSSPTQSQVCSWKDIDSDFF